mgnify:CR=1 FL=1
MSELTVAHKNSRHKKTTYDEERKLLTAFFIDGSVYQFLDVPKRLFNEIKTLEESKGKFEDLEDNDVVYEYFFNHLWENIVMRRRGNTRWFDKKMRYFYVKVKGINS